MTMKVWVVSYQYAYSNGSEGMSVVGVYSTPEKAKAAKAESIEDYLKNSADAVDENGNVNDIFDIDGVTPENMPLAEALNATCIDVDGCGTWCEWSITDMELD